MSDKPKFKDWFMARNGFFPHKPYEQQHVAVERLLNEVAEWCDMLAEESHNPPPPNPTLTE